MASNELGWRSKEMLEACPLEGLVRRVVAKDAASPTPRFEFARIGRKAFQRKKHMTSITLGVKNKPSRDQVRDTLAKHLTNGNADMATIMEYLFCTEP